MSLIKNMSLGDNLISINGKSFTNTHKVPFETAVFAAYHSTLYSGNPPREGKLSTTTIIGPLRKALYAIKQPDSLEPQDVQNLLASSKGTAMHEGMTKALNTYNSGYICEQRMEREVEGWKISGEFDILTPDKQIKDLKFVSNYNLKKLEEDKQKLTNEMTLEDMYIETPTYFKYQAQLSIYRYLLNNSSIKPYGSIIFSLNNGSDMGKYTIDSEVTFPLWPSELTEQFIADRINTIKQHLANDTMPFCSDEERGKRNGEWKLQRMSPTNHTMNTVRGSKFDNESDFRDFVRKSGRAGDQEVITEPTCVLCNYCSYNSVCDQPL